MPYKENKCEICDKDCKYDVCYNHSKKRKESIRKAMNIYRKTDKGKLSTKINNDRRNI